MAHTPLFANIAERSALNVFTFLSSPVVPVPFIVIVPKANQLTCHSFTGDLYMHQVRGPFVSVRPTFLGSEQHYADWGPDSVLKLDFGWVW